jgi:hypothetical protein
MKVRRPSSKKRSPVEFRSFPYGSVMLRSASVALMAAVLPNLMRQPWRRNCCSFASGRIGWMPEANFEQISAASVAARLKRIYESMAPEAPSKIDFPTAVVSEARSRA